jgi:hypothetical protein
VSATADALARLRRIALGLAMVSINLGALAPAAFVYGLGTPSSV